MSENIESFKMQIKQNINILINNNKLIEAKILIEEYKKNNFNDIEIYSIEAIILIIENKLDEAKSILEKGLILDKNNFDLNYNLAYLYEQNYKFNNAYKFYNIALKNCNDENIKNDLLNIIQNIKNKYDIIPIEDKQKIIFFVKKGMDSFLGDIINGLSEKYETKKIIVTSYQQIDEGMDWGDICWFEWCDELIEYGSNHNLAISKKIICRLHSYEAFDLSLKNINWTSVDKIIFISEKIKNIVVSEYNIDIDKTIVIPNGINIEKYKYKNRKNGFKIAYVGYINYKKGPMLLLHTFKSIYDMDNRYKLYIAGKFQDSRDCLYFNQMIVEFGIEDNVIFDGWQDNLDNWLEDKNYILCTSLLESQNISVMQAMAKGIKPIIHNFVGAREIYRDKFIWNNINEVVKMISSKEYNSIEYREFIKKKYSLNKQMEEINKIISDVIELEKEKITQYKYFNYEGRTIKFYLPYLKDWVQNVIYKTDDFYEKEMLADIKNRLKENSIFIDIGANIGNHTIFFSMICNAKKVYSFEPQKNIFEILKRNVELNKVDEIVKLYNMGLGKEQNFADIKVIDKNNYGMSKLVPNKGGDIEINKLDNIISIDKIKKIDIIKIDVEGMELEVLEGAKEILTRFKPMLYIEAGTESELYELIVFLKEFGYKAVKRFNATPTYLFVSE